MNRDQAALFYGIDAEFPPPAYNWPEDLANITAVPLRGWRRSEYYSDSKLLPYGTLENPAYHYVASGHILFVTLFPVLFGVGPKFCILGLCLCTYATSVVYVGGLRSVVDDIDFEIGGEDEYTRGARARALAKYNDMFSYAFPLGLMALCGVLSARKRKPVLFFFILCLFIDNRVMLTGLNAFRDHFFKAGAGLLEKVVVKGFGMGLLVSFWIEVSWQFQKHTALKCAMPRNIGVVVFVFGITYLTVNARLMTDSAETFTEACLYELSNTGAELISTHDFLRGVTPCRDYLESFKSIYRWCKGGENATAEETPESIERKSVIREMRNKFCADAVVVGGLIEASSILTVGAMLLSIPRNMAGEAGSEAVPQIQLVINILVQLFGELIVTDGLIAYASMTFTSTYTIDITQYWIKRDHSVYLAVFAYIAFSQYYFCEALGQFSCFTSVLDDEGGGEGSDDWVVQICPLPPLDITDMQQVGEKFLEEWRNATAAASAAAMSMAVP